MASIGTYPPSSTYDSTNSSSSSTSPDTSAANGNPATDPLANQSTFLTLLVSQLKNQNPLNPMDGTAFVTQLAQFSQLEQSLAMRQDLDSISTKYAGTSSTSPSSSSNSSADASGSSSTDPAATAKSSTGNTTGGNNSSPNVNS